MNKVTKWKGSRKVDGTSGWLNQTNFTISQRDLFIILRYYIYYILLLFLSLWSKSNINTNWKLYSKLLVLSLCNIYRKHLSSFTITLRVELRTFARLLIYFYVQDKGHSFRDILMHCHTLVQWRLTLLKTNRTILLNHITYKDQITYTDRFPYKQQDFLWR